MASALDRTLEENAPEGELMDWLQTANNELCSVTARRQSTPHSNTARLTNRNPVCVRHAVADSLCLGANEGSNLA